MSNNLSNDIADFCSLIDGVRRTYNWHYEEVGRLDKLTQDLLHQLELGNLSYSERAKVATQLAQCRKLRRLSKDTTDVFSAIYQFIESDRGKIAINHLKEVLGQTRKAEAKLNNRSYKYKVLQGDEI